MAGIVSGIRVEHWPLEGTYEVEGMVLDRNQAIAALSLDDFKAAPRLFRDVLAVFVGPLPGIPPSWLDRRVCIIGVSWTIAPDDLPMLTLKLIDWHDWPGVTQLH